MPYQRCPIESTAAALVLTRRELEVLQLLAMGLSNKEIAYRLVLSPRTVKAHLRSIYRKFGVRNRTSAAVKAILSHAVN